MIRNRYMFGYGTETTPGSPVVPYYHLQVVSASFNPEIAYIDAGLKQPYFSRVKKQVGRMAASLSFESNLLFSSSATTPPPGSHILRAAGLEETVNTSDVTYTPSTGQIYTLTVGLITDEMVRFKAAGVSVSSLTIRGEAGGLLTLQAEMSGKYAGRESVASWPSYIYTSPIPVLGAVLNGVTAFLQSFSFEIRNNVSLLPNAESPEGVDYAVITDRETTLTMTLVSYDAGLMDAYEAGSTVSNVSIHFSNGTRNFEIVVPTAQVVSVQPLEEVDGFLAMTVELLPVPSSGDDEFSLIFS